MDTILSKWESYYVIVGSSAAGLTGLQFVVMTLIAQSDRRGGAAEISAFGTPTVVYFCAALLISAILSAPWGGLGGPALSVAFAGASGVLYSCVVIHRARRQQGYDPVWEDWLWHTILPTLAYVALTLAGLVLRWHPVPALFVIAGATLSLVFIGIHNAWDTVTYLMLAQPAPKPTATSPPPPPATPMPGAPPPPPAATTAPPSASTEALPPTD